MYLRRTVKPVSQSRRIRTPFDVVCALVWTSQYLHASHSPVTLTRHTHLTLTCHNLVQLVTSNVAFPSAGALLVVPPPSSSDGLQCLQGAQLTFNWSNIVVPPVQEMAERSLVGRTPRGILRMRLSECSLPLCPPPPPNPISSR